MPTDSSEATRPLPDRPNLRHLKDQAKDLLKTGQADSLTDAQYKIAQRYGFANWPKLKAHVETLEEIGQLKQAIDTNDLATVKKLMTRNSALHSAPLGYNKNGPLTWVAECRVPWEPPSATRLAMAEWMIEHGSDVHQGGDGPLMRAALVGHRAPMMELLVSRGADVNAQWNGYFPIIFAPCETVEPIPLKWRWTMAPIPVARNPAASIRARRWITLSALIHAQTSWASASICLRRPNALPGTTCRQCWICCEAASIYCKNILMPSRRWCIGNLRNLISARQRNAA